MSKSGFDYTVIPKVGEKKEDDEMSKRQVIVAIALLVILICVPVLGQINNEDMSYGRANGRYYLKCDGQARIALLYGIEQGIIFLYDENEISVETLNRYTVRGFTFSDLKSQVDKLYEDKANIRIPISYAYLYATRRARGDSPREIEDFLSQLRKRFL